MKPDKKKVGERINYIKNSLGLSLTELGARLGGIPKGTIDSWKRGLALPPKEVANQLAFIAGTSVNWIYWGVDTLDTEFCLHCNNPIVKGLCENCLLAREVEMINLYDMVDSKLFPMTCERKSQILRIVDAEINEIRTQLNML